MVLAKEYAENDIVYQEKIKVNFNSIIWQAAGHDDHRPLTQWCSWKTGEILQVFLSGLD